MRGSGCAAASATTRSDHAKTPTPRPPRCICFLPSVWAVAVCLQVYYCRYASPWAYPSMTCVSGRGAWISHELQPIHPRHVEIGQYRGDVVFFEELQSNFGTRGRRHRIPFAGEIVA